MSAVRIRQGRPKFARVAQLVEHLVEAQGVGGSSPSPCTIRLLALRLVVGHRILIPVAEVRILEGQPSLSYK